jgi:RNA polymerase sigma-70 factor (ECF subfamily)
MSSEAAYFPDALSGASEALRTTDLASESRPELHDEIQVACALSVHLPVTVAQNPEISDEFLLEQVRVGAKDAITILFRRHARAVRNVAYRILRNEAEADDLVQDVFLFIFRKALLFKNAQSSGASWIIHVAYHRAFDRRRYLN